MLDLLDRSSSMELTPNGFREDQNVGQARSQLLHEEDAEFESPFTKRGLFT